MSDILDLVAIMQRRDELGEVYPCIFVGEALVLFHDFVLQSTPLEIVHEYVDLLAGRIVDDLVEFYYVLVGKGFQNVEFLCLDVVRLLCSKVASLHSELFAFDALDSVLLLCLDMNA